MLQRETIDARAFTILKRIQALEDLKDFYLVGGTALALQRGHRKSVDLDLFSKEEFDNKKIIKIFEREFGDLFIYEGGQHDFSIFCFIEDVKVDLIKYSHPIISEPVVTEDIRMYSMKDIAAMKVQAIYGRAVKKDFWDMAELLEVFCLKEIIDFHSEKFPSNQILLSVPQALIYFEEAEDSEEPVSLKGQNWLQIKKGITKKVNEFLK